MLEKSYRNKSIIPLGFFVVLGATMGFRHLALIAAFGLCG